MRTTPLLTGVLLIFCTYSPLFSQTSVNESDLTSLYNKAHDLFHKQKYASAQSKFIDYVSVGNNDLLVSESRFYASICAGELMLNNTEQKALIFREDEINTRQANSRFKLGEYYFRSKNYKNALLEFVEIEPLVSLDPFENEAYFFMTGYCQFVEGNLKEARAYFDEIKDYQHEYYHLANYFAAYVSFE